MTLIVPQEEILDTKIICHLHIHTGARHVSLYCIGATVSNHDHLF